MQLETDKNHAKVHQRSKSNNQEKQCPKVVKLHTNMAPKRSISTNPAKCTACFDSIETSAAARIHPLIGVLVCRECYDSYGDGNFEQMKDGVDEAGDDNFCRWCVDGGDLFVCMNENKNATNDKCHYCFCRDCLESNVPDDPILHLDTSLNPNFKWQCYACDPTKLADQRKYALEVLQRLTGKKYENLVKKRKTEHTFTRTKKRISSLKPTSTKRLTLSTSDVKIGTTIKTNVTTISSKLDTSITTNKTDNASTSENKIGAVTTTTTSSCKESTSSVKDLRTSHKKDSTTTNNKKSTTTTSNEVENSTTVEQTTTTVSNNKMDTTTPDKENKSISANKVLNKYQTSISSSFKKNIPLSELLKRLEVYRKTKDVTVEEISTKFDTIVDLVSKESDDKLLKVQIESLRTSMLEFETMINDLKSQLIQKD